MDIDILMQRFLDLTNDLAFKKVFSYKTTLIAFLNTILDLKDAHEIVDLEYIAQEEVPVRLDEQKRAIMDVRCLTKNNIYFIVEMQNCAEKAFAKRVQFYAANTYTNQLSKGQEHVDLKPVVLVSIVGETIFDDDPECISYHKTINISTGISHLKDVSYVFVELPKFQKTKEECVTLQDQWLYTFQNAADEMDIPFGNNTLQEVYEHLEKARWTKDEFQDYIWIKLRDASIAEKLKDEFEAGEAKGKVAGETETTKNIARTLTKMGMSIGQIIEATGLTAEEIAQL